MPTCFTFSTLSSSSGSIGAVRVTRLLMGILMIERLCSQEMKRMKGLKKLAFVCAMVGTTILPASCMGVFLRDMRTAAIGGAADFVEDGAFTLLDRFVVLDGAEGEE